VGQTFIDQTALTGLRSLLDAIDEPERFAEQYGANLVSGTIPLSGAVRTAAQATDRKLRQPEGIAERVQAGVPRLSEALLPKLDALGREVKRDPTGLGALQPFVGAKQSNDPVDRELERLQVYPAPVGETLKIGEADVKLSRPLRQEYQRVTGDLMYRNLRALFASPLYQQASLEKRTQVVEERLETTRENTTKALKHYLKGERKKQLPAGMDARQMLERWYKERVGS
jgi:hypothetical protein